MVIGFWGSQSDGASHVWHLDASASPARPAPSFAITPGLLWVTAEKIVEQCFLFMDYQGRAVPFAERLGLAFHEEYQNNGNCLTVVNNRLSRYAALAREAGGNTVAFFAKAAEVVFATANIEDERLRLHMLSQEVAV